MGEEREDNLKRRERLRSEKEKMICEAWKRRKVSSKMRVVEI